MTISISIFTFLLIMISSALGIYFDLSGGDPGLDSLCPPGNPMVGAWIEEDASKYETASSGPLTGLVLTSESGVATCLRTPESFDVQSNHSFKMSVFMPAAEIANNKRKIQVWLVEEDESPSKIIAELKGPSSADWYLIDAKVPATHTYPNKFRIEIWVTVDIEFVAVRWFGVSDEPLPPPEEPPTEMPTTTEEETEEPTEDTMEPTDVTTEFTLETEEPTEGTTEYTEETEEPTEDTMEPTDVTTEFTLETEEPTEGTTEFTEETEEPTESTLEPTEETTEETTVTEPTTTTRRTTTTKPISTTTPRTTTTGATSSTTVPPEPDVFPNLWSVLLGIALGTLIMSLIFFLFICCWWFCAVRKKDAQYIDESNLAPLPRLQVRSGWSEGGSHKSIIASSWARDSRAAERGWSSRRKW